MIDYTKPIETVPCVRNPNPVPCTYDRGRVRINGDWIDWDGEDEGGTFWGVNSHGQFRILDGSVRNVASANHKIRDKMAMTVLPLIYDKYETVEQVARACYHMADAMIRERGE